MAGVLKFLVLLAMAVPVAFFVSIGLLTFLDPEDSWQMPAQTDFLLSVAVLAGGLWVYRQLQKEGRRRRMIERVTDPFQPDPMRKWDQVR